jgi:hypothetical protein
LSSGIYNISHTPLVGAPLYLSNALAKVGIESKFGYLMPYKNQAFSDLCKYEIFDLNSLIDEILTDSRILIIHNFLPKNIEEKLFKSVKKTNHLFVQRHIHSPFYEEPVARRLHDKNNEWVDVVTFLDQFQSTVSGVGKGLPNIIPLELFRKERVDKDNISILYSPSGKKSRGYSAKRGLATEEFLDHCESVGLDVYIPDRVLSISELQDLRSKCHFVLDEIETGAFHRTSLEAIAAGSIPISQANSIFLNQFLDGRCLESSHSKLFSSPLDLLENANILYQRKKEEIKDIDIQDLLYYNPTQIWQEWLNNVY